MTVSPRTMAQQVRKAQAVKAERERIARVAPQVRKAFTSETGVKRVQYRGVESALHGLVVMEDDPHCFICSRHTDHFAEHDDMVEAGYAQYEDDGSVTWTEKGWNEYRA